MSIDELEELLSYSRILPQNVVLVKEQVTVSEDKKVLLKGLQPFQRRDTIVLTPQASTDTPFHEIVHMLGVQNELVAEVLGRFMARKYQFLKRRQRLASLLRRDVEYELCSGCQEFRKVHEQDERLEHYSLKPSRGLVVGQLKRRYIPQRLRRNLFRLQQVKYR